MPNYNEKTGVPYGVLQGNDVPELLNEIMSQGEDLTFVSYRQEFLDRLKHTVSESIRELLSEYDQAELAEKLVDCEDILDQLENAGLWDNDYSEEHEYSYTLDSPDGPIKLLVSWLGGAPHIWVIDSPYVCRCRPCSPCIPGAGDLDTPDEKGDIAYCLDAGNMPDEWHTTNDASRQVFMAEDIMRDKDGLFV